MKRYLAFYGSIYYPRGGMDDFIGDFDTEEEAITSIELKHNSKNPQDEFWNYNFANIWDSETRTEIYSK